MNNYSFRKLRPVLIRDNSVQLMLRPIIVATFALVYLNASNAYSCDVNGCESKWIGLGGISTAGQILGNTWDKSNTTGWKTTLKSVCPFIAECSCWAETSPNKGNIIQLSKLCEAQKIEEKQVAGTAAANASAVTDCKTQNYTTCFGLKWGSAITMEPSSADVSRQVISGADFEKVCPKGGGYMDEDFIQNCGTALTPIEETATLIRSNSSCAMIASGANKSSATFVGAVRGLPEMTEAETMLVKSELRKKYGDPVKNGSCETGGYGANYYQFKGQNGLEVVLDIIKQDGDKDRKSTRLNSSH